MKKYRIIDSLTTLPIIEGKVLIKSKFDTLFTFPIKDGYFSLKCTEMLNDNHLSISIICKGYDTLDLNIDSSFCLSDSVTIFRMKPHANYLKNVEVSAKMRLIKQDIDKIVYNVSKDADSKFLSLLEIMPKLPFVSLSPEENLLLKGKTNFIVLLDGKRSSLFSKKTLREALKAIPASNILNIEIITDPPPRYENEGYTGAINIITLKKIGDGYNSSLNISGGTFISGINGTFNIRSGKLGAIFVGGSNFERTPYNSFYSETSYSDFRITQIGERKVNSTPRNADIILSYEKDSLNLFTLEFGGSGGSTKYSSFTEAESKLNNNTLLNNYSFQLNQKDVNNELNLNINYQKNFKKLKERLLTFSYILNKNRGATDISNFLTQSINFVGSNYLQVSKNGQLENAMQLDYVHPIKRLKIEAGAKYINRDIFDNFSTNVINPSTGNAFVDSLNTNNFKYHLSILGMYNSYLLKFKLFSLRAGLRFETTSLSGSFDFDKSKINQSYTNLLPSFKFQYKANENTIYSVSFKQQIQRPGIALLNPQIIRTAPGFYSSGNPTLRPVLTNSINIDFNHFKKASTSLTVNYSFQIIVFKVFLQFPVTLRCQLVFKTLGSTNVSESI